MEATVEYVKVRQQFGRAIGEFQAIKHRCADMFVLSQAAAASVHSAWSRIERVGVESDADVLACSAYATQALIANDKAAMQLHGGMAFTWEHESQRFHKRAKATQLVIGGGDEAIAALATAVLDTGESILTALTGEH